MPINRQPQGFQFQPGAASVRDSFASRGLPTVPVNRFSLADEMFEGVGPGLARAVDNYFESQDYNPETDPRAWRALEDAYQVEDLKRKQGAQDEIADLFTTSELDDQAGLGRRASAAAVKAGISGKDLSDRLALWTSMNGGKEDQIVRSFAGNGPQDPKKAFLRETGDRLLADERAQESALKQDDIAGQMDRLLVEEQGRNARNTESLAAAAARNTESLAAAAARNAAAIDGRAAAAAAKTGPNGKPLIPLTQLDDFRAELSAQLNQRGGPETIYAGADPQAVEDAVLNRAYEIFAQTNDAMGAIRQARQELLEQEMDADWFTDKEPTGKWQLKAPKTQSGADAEAAAPAAPAASVKPPPINERVQGTIYQTPMGPMQWNGVGWVKPGPSA